MVGEQMAKAGPAVTSPFLQMGQASMAANETIQANQRYSHSQPALPRTDEDVRSALSQLPRYRVMLHNDDVNSMDHVVFALIRVIPRLTTEEAVRVMLEAHTSGVAQVIICPKETAEFYRDGLERYGLTSTIEPA
jgi:ATP-dependent Clp protease adaptor protein ClpS